MGGEGVGGILDMDYWRDYFGGAPSDIFGVIEKAILVAAADRPEEFLSRRDGIAETLFSCRSTARCLGCDGMELRMPCRGEEREGEGSKRRVGDEDTPGGGGTVTTDGCAGKSSNVNSSCDDGDDDGLPGGASNGGGGLNVSNYSYDEAEALTEEIEEENMIAGEVLRIKDLLLEHEEKSESVLFDSLRRLQLMALSVETLQATNIGKAVNGLKRHKSKPIRHLARTLIDGWKVMVDEWVSSTTVVQEATPESANPQVNYDDDEEDDGLPLPPMDEAAFLTTQTTAMELSQFFDGMDDDGNPQFFDEFTKDVEKGKKPMPERNTTQRRKPLPSTPEEYVPENSTAQRRKPLPSTHEEYVPEEYRPPGQANESLSLNKDKRQPPQEQNKAKIQSNRLEMAQNYLQKQTKGPSGRDSGSGAARPAQMQNREQRGGRDVRPMAQQPARAEFQRRPVSGLQDKANCSDEGSVRAKLEIAKRKLHEGYQQAETAKRQRTIQVMEIHDLPKQAPNFRPPHPKATGHNRNWANGRR